MVMGWHLNETSGIIYGMTKKHHPKSRLERLQLEQKKAERKARAKERDSEIRTIREQIKFQETEDVLREEGILGKV